MVSTRQCAKCGLVLGDASAATCPGCGARIGPSVGALWIVALIQIAAATTFMLVFRFPRILIVIFGAVILIATALSLRIKLKPAPGPRPQQRPLSHPTLFRILSVAIALCSIVIFSILLFGFVMFANSWSSWEQYKGAAYHRADFLVTHVYFQRGSKGGVDAYASGTVEGGREWMSLPRSLYATTRNQSELEESVPVGTSIPIYLFPQMKGRARVRVYQEVPTAETYHREAINALKNSLSGLALSGGILFVLLRLRRSCFDESQPALPLVQQNF